mmetsp:Transcript_20949/g.29272  ORF Transcript_20949/g.29272 Transcript_20949/m.29272 type:complete len:233 (-) Transcript_20949:267-965(-)
MTATTLTSEDSAVVTENLAKPDEIFTSKSFDVQSYGVPIIGEVVVTEPEGDDDNKGFLQGRSTYIGVIVAAVVVVLVLIFVCACCIRCCSRKDEKKAVASQKSVANGTAVGTAGGQTMKKKHKQSQRGKVAKKTDGNETKALQVETVSTADREMGSTGVHDSKKLSKASSLAMGAGSTAAAGASVAGAGYPSIEEMKEVSKEEEAKFAPKEAESKLEEPSKEEEAKLAGIYV